MFFKFTTIDGVEHDLTDYVDEVSIAVEREAAVSPAGLLNHSAMLGESIVSGLTISTRGVLFAPDFANLRATLKKLFESRRGFLQLEPDRKMPAIFAGSSPDISEWIGGVPVMRVAMRFMTAGYAQDVGYRYGSAISNGWSVSNTGDMPCPLRIQLQFRDAQSGQKVLIMGGKAPDGTTNVDMQWQGNVSANSILVIDSGVDALRVTLDGYEDSDGITSGYPPYLAAGSSNITYSLVPANTIVSRELRFYRRWKFL